MSDLHKTLEPYHEQALTALAEPAAIGPMLDTAQRRVIGIPALQEGLAAMRGLVQDYVSQEFERADDDEVAWALAAIMYVISPWDLAPDYLPGGMRDDERIVRAVSEMISPVLREYADWVHRTRRSYRTDSRPV